MNSARRSPAPTRRRCPIRLIALWHDAQGNWAEAHRIAQHVPGAAGAWVHAYLHRKEGDLKRRLLVSESGPTGRDRSLETEWTRIVSALLGP